MKAVLKTLEVLVRFPLTMASFIGFFIIAIRLDGCCEFWNNLDDTALEEILPFLFIGFFLMLFIESYSERKKINSAYLAFPIIIILWRYFLYLSTDIGKFNHSQTSQIFFLFLVSVVLAMTTLLISKESQKSFWHYNRRLVMRLVFSVFITVALCKILEIFLQSIASSIYLCFDFFYLYLPDFGENSSVIAILVASIAGILFFLSGIPKTSKTRCFNKF